MIPSSGLSKEHITRLDLDPKCVYRVFSKKCPIRLLGIRFKVRNCISEPGSLEPYKDIY
jgi:hypothetical protein